MNNHKKEMRKEFVEQLKRLFILVFSLLLIYFGISITSIFKSIDNEKIIWTLDFGIYNILFNLIWTHMDYKIQSKKLNIDLKIFDVKNKGNVINLNKGNEKIKIELKFFGKAKKKYPKISILFPGWVDIQLRDRNYLEIDYENSRVIIDIAELVKYKNTLNFTESITMDLISSSDESGSEDYSDSKLEDVSYFMEKFITYNKDEINIKNG